MKLRGLIIAVVVLLALGGVLYWSNHHKASTPSTSLSSTASPSILKLNQASMTGLTLTDKGSAPVTLVKQNDDRWQITEPKELRADQDGVTSLLSTLSNLNADRVVEEKASNLAQYGLEDPSVSVDIETSDHKQRRLMLGDSTPAGDDVYAMLGGDHRVFTIASYDKTSIDKGLNDLRDKHLLTVDPDKVSRVTFDKKGQTIEFARIRDGWQILKPAPLRADSFAVDELVRGVADARMDLNGSKSDAAAEFAKGTPVATVSLTGARGTETLELRKNEDDDYARSSALPGIYKVDSILDSTLSQSLNSFRNKKLFDFGFEDPNKIELHEGSRVWFLSRNGTNWWSNGTKMDGAAIESLVDKLRNLAATGFPTSGFSSAAIQVMVTSAGGKQVEKVSISKSGDHYLAKRDNEPSLYQLSASDVSDLTAAINAIKPTAIAK